MSIEPTSVSSRVMRGNDNGSLHSMGGKTQGSATGRKEGQFGSFWDKAVFGAQKLFGMERSSIDGLEERGLDNDEDSAREDNNPENRSGSQQRLSSVFAGAGLGRRLSQTVRHEVVGNMPAFGASDRSFEASSREEPNRDAALGDRSMVRRPDSSEANLESGISNVASEDRSDELSEADESDGKLRKNAAKVADLPVRAMPFVDRLASSRHGENLLVGNNQRVASSLEVVGTNPAKQSARDPNMPSLTANPITQLTDTSPSTPVVGGRGSSEAAPLGVAGTGEVKNALGKEISAMAKDSRASGEAISQLAQSANHKSTGEQAVKGDTVAHEVLKASGKNGGELAFDSEKAQHSLSKAFEKTGSMDSVRQTKAPEAKLVPVGTAEFTGQSKMPSNLLDAGKPETTDSKLSDYVVQKPTAAKSQMAQQRVAVASQQSPTQSNPENSGSEVLATKKVDTHSFHEAIREMRPVDSRPQVNRNRPVNANMATIASVPASTITTALAGMGAQPQGDSSGHSGKQGFDMSSARDVAPKASASTPKGEASQGFQMNGSSSASSNKSAAVAKSQPASYSSKTAEEVKEVYTALTKSVDRLVNTKGDTINVRINFDQGGSIALKVSMEGGQIKTMMQTDLPGLESMIKSNWSELAADWNAKGVKLNAPQFTNSEGGLSREEGSSNFTQRENQSQNEFSGNSGSQGSRRSERAVAGSNVDASHSESVSQVSESEVTGEGELKTYA